MEEKQTSAPVGWLRKSEKLFRTDMVYVFRSSFWMGIGQAVGVLTAFLVASLQAHVLLRPTLGDLRVIFSVGGVIGAFSMTGLSVAVTRAAARGEDGALSSGFWSNLLWSFPALLVGLPVAWYYYRSGSPAVAWGLAVAVPGILVLQSTELAGAYLTGKKKFKAGTGVAILQALLPAAATAGALFVTHDPVLLTAAFYGSNLAIALPIYAWVVRHHRGTEVQATGKSAVNYGKHLSFMNVLGTISFQLDKVLTERILGKDAVAVYSIAMAPPQNLRLLGKNLSAISLPKLAEKEPAELKRLVPRKAVVVLVLSIALIAAYWLGAPYLYRWFFPKYLDSIVYSRWYSLLILSFPLVLFQNSLVAHQETRAQYVIQTTIPIFKTCLFLFAIPRFHIAGVVGSILVTEVLHILLVLFFFSRMKTPAKHVALPEVIPATEGDL